MATETPYREHGASLLDVAMEPDAPKPLRRCPVCGGQVGGVLHHGAHEGCAIASTHVHQACGAPRCEAAWTAAVVLRRERRERRAPEIVETWSDRNPATVGMALACTTVLIIAWLISRLR